MPETSDIAGIPTRRTVVASVGAAGLAAALTACGGSEDSSNSGSGAVAPVQGSAASHDSGSGGGGGTELAETSDIPPGGGKVFKAQKVVVTQPTSGQFKAFSAVCPHAGCLVNEVAGGTINCPCHHSKFSVTDGSRTAGPATSGLTATNITVQGTAIKLE